MMFRYLQIVNRDRFWLFQGPGAQNDCEKGNAGECLV